MQLVRFGAALGPGHLVPRPPAPAPPPPPPPAPDAVTSFGFTVTPESVEPGGTVTLRATECQAPSVTASSDAFAPVTLTESLPATAKVDPDARPGAAYDVTFDCQGERGTARLLIDAKAAGAAAGDTRAGDTRAADPVEDPLADPLDEPLDEPLDVPSAQDTEAHDTAGTGTEAHDTTGTAADRSDPALKPDGGVRAGAGGSLPESGTERIAAGSALVAGAAAGGIVLFAVRRRRAATRG
ncbi:hypothetical protein [Streptomyces sp. NPDC058953]|uniref:hypothetical protein n=1 Tax=Streptomyces sp. NPDC058953 TaxID=3346676 RepID=UPI0036C88F42